MLNSRKAPDISEILPYRSVYRVFWRSAGYSFLRSPMPEPASPAQSCAPRKLQRYLAHRDGIAPPRLAPLLLQRRFFGKALSTQ